MLGSTARARCTPTPTPVNERGIAYSIGVPSEFVTYIALTTWYTLKELKRAPEGAQIPESASTTDGS